MSEYSGWMRTRLRAAFFHIHGSAHEVDAFDRSEGVASSGQVQLCAFIDFRVLTWILIAVNGAFSLCRRPA